MKITELLGAAALVRGGARASNTIGQSMLASFVATAAERVRPDFESGCQGCEQHYEGGMVALLPIDKAMDRFMEFAEEELAEWRKTAAHTTPDGVAVASYSGRISPHVTLRARSYWARVVQNDHARQRAGGWHVQAQITYRYRVRFELRLQGPLRTMVTFRTTEAIDPDLSCGYDLARHFEAPSMPAGFGRIGERFLATLPR